MKHDDPDPASHDDMTDDQAEQVLAEALEDFHRRRARGERPNEADYRKQLGEELYPQFVELVAAETIIDLALEPAGDETHLPLAWGPYTLIHEIARGAAGVVYEAIHRKLGRKVALKVLRTGVDTDRVARERFHREARALAHVKHDNIVEIYEADEIDGRPYYAMSLVNGPTLKELLKSGQAPEPREVCRGLAGVADALATLHAEGIIHRDVKPQNIIVDADGRYMLADFGLARSSLAETMTQSGDALGTPLYMSPEQILGNRDEIEERTDVYGLGATLYEMLAHQPPFKTDNLQALMRMILHERPVRIRDVNPAVPKACSNIAETCLQKELRDRVGSAAALRDDLMAAAEGERVAAAPMTRFERAVRQASKHPVLAAAAVVLLAIGVWFVTRPPEPATIDLQIYGPAMAKLDGGALEPIPWMGRELASNRTYELEIVPDDTETYLTLHETLVAEPGSRFTIRRGLEPRDGTNSRAGMDAKYGELGVERAEPGKPASHRGPVEYVAQVQFPRGRVRPSDLGDFEVQLGSAKHERKIVEHSKSAIDFFIGADRVASVPIAGDEAAYLRAPIPTAVRERAEPGTVVRWGYRLPGSDSLVDEATFEIVAEDPSIDARLAKIAQVFERDWVSNAIERERAIRLMSAELLLQNELPYAAWRTLQAPFEAEERAVEAEMARHGDAMAAATAKLGEAEGALQALYDRVPPEDEAARAAYDKALKAAERRVEEADRDLSVFYERHIALQEQPRMFRSLPLLSVQQAVLERLFPSRTQRQDNVWYRKHAQWRGMFSDEAWSAYRSR